MPTSDITMCKDSYCPLRKNCHRYIAKPSENQSYQHWPRLGPNCKGYMPINEDEEQTDA